MGNYATIYVMSYSEMSLSICGRAVQTLHCTILLENKRAQHGNVSREMEKGKPRETPTFDLDTAMLDFIKTAPRLFIMLLQTNSPRLNECLLLRTTTDAGRRGEHYRYPRQNNLDPRGIPGAKLRRKGYVKSRQRTSFYFNY